MQALASEAADFRASADQSPTSGVFCSWCTVASQGMPFLSAVPLSTCLAPTFMSA